MKRHRWFKWKTHHRMCLHCGLIKVNILKGGQWIQEYHTPDGDVVTLSATPGCAPGSLTPKRLADLTEFIAKHPSVAEVQGTRTRAGATA